MLPANLIAKKRDGQPLADEEIRSLIRGFVRGDVTDDQMAALAMAIFIRGMSPREVSTLTLAMRDSGRGLDRSVSESMGRPRVDKHSTGGLGDKVSLILAPLLAACEVHVPMVSGRGLGLSGGTLDKLEAIDGFDVHPSPRRCDQLLRDVGAFIVGADEHVAPADRRLYAIRDVTGTVESIPLITASILSKKLSANLDALVMDVKCGSAAFMKTAESAGELAESIVRVSGEAGVPTTAIVSDMDQPLGRTIGNAIEVNESLDVLEGEGGPVRELTIELCAHALWATGVAAGLDPARQLCQRRLDDGSAREGFAKLIAAQGGAIDGHLPVAEPTVVESTRDGYVEHFDCHTIGSMIVDLGGGRRRQGDMIDHSVGVELHAHVGDRVVRGQPLATLHAPRHRCETEATRLSRAIVIGDEPRQRSLILDRLIPQGRTAP